MLNLERHPAARHQCPDTMTMNRQLPPPHPVGERHRNRVDPLSPQQLVKQRLPQRDDKLSPRDRLGERELQRDDIFQRHAPDLGVVPRDAQRVRVCAVGQEHHPRREISLRGFCAQSQHDRREQKNVGREGGQRAATVRNSGVFSSAHSTRSAMSDRHRPPLRQSLGRPASAQVTERDGQFEGKVRAACPRRFTASGCCPRWGFPCATVSQTYAATRGEKMAERIGFESVFRLEAKSLCSRGLS